MLVWLRVAIVTNKKKSAVALLIPEAFDFRLHMIPKGMVLQEKLFWEIFFSKILENKIWNLEKKRSLKSVREIRGFFSVHETQNHHILRFLLSILMIFFSLDSKFHFL